MAKQIVTLPYHIKIEGEHFADEEIGQTKKNPSRNSPEWKKAFNRYVKEAYEHSLVPSKNNPGTPKVSLRIAHENYPEIFGKEGLISRVTGKEPYTPEWNNVDGRIRGAVGNLFQMYVESVLGMKTKRDHKAGSGAPKDELSVFEFATKSGKSEDKVYQEELKTIMAQYHRYLIEELIYEFLIPLLEFTPDDVKKVMLSTGIQKESFDLNLLKSAEARIMFVMALRNRVKKKILKKDAIVDMFVNY